MEQFTPLSAMIGGAIIGISSALFLAFNGRIAGVSGVASGIFSRKNTKFYLALFIPDWTDRRRRRLSLGGGQLAGNQYHLISTSSDRGRTINRHRNRYG